MEVARFNPFLSKRPPQQEPLTLERKVDNTKKRMPLPIRHLSTIRTVRPPDVKSPCEWVADVPPSLQELRIPIPWGAPDKTRSDQCIDSETDEDEFDAEMDDEDKVEAADVEQQEAYERGLWILISGARTKRKRPAEDDDQKEDGELEEEGAKTAADIAEVADGDKAEDVLEADAVVEAEDIVMEGPDAANEEAKTQTPPLVPPRQTRARRQGTRRNKKFKSKEYISDSD